MRISDWMSDVCSSDLTAVDIELGMSGRLGAADFELSAYQSRFKGEVLIQVDQNFARVDARNAERTVVDGIEAATSFRLANNLSGRLAYAYESARFRSEEHTSELQSLMRISYAV